MPSLSVVLDDFPPSRISPLRKRPKLQFMWVPSMKINHWFRYSFMRSVIQEMKLHLLYQTFLSQDKWLGFFFLMDICLCFLWRLAYMFLLNYFLINTAYVFRVHSMYNSHWRYSSSSSGVCQNWKLPNTWGAKIKSTAPIFLFYYASVPKRLFPCHRTTMQTGKLTPHQDLRAHVHENAP